VLSFGVLYHRRSPEQHLNRLYVCLAPGGQLALETLVTTESSDDVVPQKRYANMRNVWCIPTIEHLRKWLQRAGFSQITVADVTRTTTAEQRQTDWMPFHSLRDALDPVDERRTVEGYPAPTRALMLARKPH
jgi:tRNA (mo5U34)-methyltransferase